MLFRAAGADRRRRPLRLLLQERSVRASQANRRLAGQSGDQLHAVRRGHALADPRLLQSDDQQRKA